MMLRPAILSDEAIIKQWVLDKNDCKWFMNREEFLTEDFVAWVNAKDQHGYVLVNDAGEVNAYGEIWQDDEEKDLELAHLVVDPNLRGKGIGKKLVALLEDEAKRIGYPALYMRVNPNNIAALQCYKGAKFEMDYIMQEKLGPEWVWLKKQIHAS